MFRTSCFNSCLIQLLGSTIPFFICEKDKCKISKNNLLPYKIKVRRETKMTHIKMTRYASNLTLNKNFTVYLSKHETPYGLGTRTKGVTWMCIFAHIFLHPLVKAMVRSRTNIQSVNFSVDVWAPRFKQLPRWVVMRFELFREVLEDVTAFLRQGRARHYTGTLLRRFYSVRRWFNAVQVARVEIAFSQKLAHKKEEKEMYRGDATRAEDEKLTYVQL